MTYYLLPKTNTFLSIKMNVQHEKLEPYLSPSLFFFYQKLSDQLTSLSFTKEENEYIYEKNVENISKIFHPYEYIFKKMPNSKLSVSKLKFKKEIFYEFYEMNKTIYLLEDFSKKNMSILNISPNSNSVQECIEFIRDNKNDEYISNSSFDFSSFIEEIHNNNNNNNNTNKHSNEKENIPLDPQEKKFDFIFYELEKEKYENINDYVIGLIQIILIILKTQKENGSSIIKVNAVFFKPIVDCIYLLSSFYQKTYIIKPIINNVSTFYKYIICKNFIDDPSSISQQNQRTHYYEKFNYYLDKMKDFQKKESDLPLYISSLFDYSLPCYFITKINDININIGQQQLDIIQQMILFFKNKNKEKINQLIKIHIYKCMKWCDKFKIPYNTNLNGMLITNTTQIHSNEDVI